MNYILTGLQMKQADKYTIEQIGIPSMVLMERAALQIVNVIEEESLDCSNVLVVCGTGNNGGDGYAVARLLHLKGIKITVLSVGNDDKRSLENQTQKAIVEHYQIPIKQSIENENYSLIIDAVFGIGLKRPVDGELKAVIEKLNAMTAYKLAIDISSGLDDTSGETLGVAFDADMTIALAYAKRGQLIKSEHPKVGKLRIVDIGININSDTVEGPLCFTFDLMDFCKKFPKRAEDSHKGTYGKVLLIVGSKGMAGAAHLCAKAAYASGCGLVRVYTHEDNREILQKTIPEAMVTTYEEYNYKQLEELLDWADVVGIGCGLGTSEDAKSMTKQVLKNENIHCVIDADALNLIANEMSCLGPGGQSRILTPHMKEMTRLLGSNISELQGDKFGQLQNFCEKHGLTCVLKDARTLIYHKDNDFFLNTTGNSSMAKGGSGDVLTGIISGILAQKHDAYESACLGVYLHGMAGDLAAKEKGKYSVLASDLVDYIGEVLKQI